MSICELRVKNGLWWCSCGWAPKPFDKRSIGVKWSEHYYEKKVKS